MLLFRWFFKRKIIQPDVSQSKSKIFSIQDDPTHSWDDIWKKVGTKIPIIPKEKRPQIEYFLRFDNKTDSGAIIKDPLVPLLKKISYEKYPKFPTKIVDYRKKIKRKYLLWGAILGTIFVAPPVLLWIYEWVLEPAKYTFEEPELIMQFIYASVAPVIAKHPDIIKLLGQPVLIKETLEDLNDQLEAWDDITERAITFSLIGSKHTAKCTILILTGFFSWRFFLESIYIDFPDEKTEYGYQIHEFNPYDMLPEDLVEFDFWDMVPKLSNLDV